MSQLPPSISVGPTSIRAPKDINTTEVAYQSLRTDRSVYIFERKHCQQIVSKWTRSNLYHVTSSFSSYNTLTVPVVSIMFSQANAAEDGTSRDVELKVTGRVRARPRILNARTCERSA
jgi:hypothetical protein